MTIDLNDSEASENEEQYSKLADAVSQLDNTQRVKAPTRKEISSVISEFHLTKEKNVKGVLVKANELAAALYNKSASHAEISNKVKSVLKKAKTLPKPLETPVAERIKRVIGYENVKGQLKKWNALVEKNRVADHLSFPLKKGSFSLQSSSEFLNKFKLKTPLEIEMAKILGAKTQEATDDETDKNLEFPLTFEEMMEKKKELAKMRAKLSYQEAKAYRQSKIKSKKYHRILKKEKIKQQLKEFEQLQKTDPEAALKKLEELDKSRAQERASLRHKSTGKWARNMAVRAKYDKESRKVLAEQLKLSKDLTAKAKNLLSDEDLSDHEIPDKEQQDIFTTSDNPWALKVSSEVSDFVSTCKKYWENKNIEKEKKSNSENQISPKATEEKSLTNGIKETIDQTCNVLNVGDSNCTYSEGITNDVNVDHSQFKTKNTKVIKNQSQIVNNEQCKDSEDSVTVLRKGKNKRIEKNSNIFDNNNAVEKQKKSIKNMSGRKSKRDKVASRETKIKTKLPSSSGLWTVVELNDKEEKKPEKRKNIKDIDDLFEDLEEKLASKTSKKLKILNEKYSEKKAKEEKVESDSNDDEDLSFKNRSNLRPEIDEEMTETRGKEPEVNVDLGALSQTTINLEISNCDTAPPEIDPKKFIELKPKKLNTKLPDNLTGDENDLIMDDEDAAQQMNIIEAFGDDDVVEEFEEMKKEEEEKTKLEIPEALPGWGSWGGTDIKPDERKTKRNMVSVPKLPPRKDKNKKDIIIREKTNEKFLEHMVKDVPYPFKSVGAFESNMRHPVGRDWIPETAHRKFIKKPVETLMGTIIEPMDESELLRLQKKNKSLYRGKKKEKS